MFLSFYVVNKGKIMGQFIKLPSLIGQTLANPIALLKRKLLITRSSAFLFVTGLRVKRKRDEVAFFGNVIWHLPFFLSNRLAKTYFGWLIIRRHPGNHFN